MRTVVLLGAVLAAAGCTHIDDMAQKPKPPVVGMTEPKYDSLGHSHEPYTGKPKYLAEARPMLPTTSAPATPTVGEPNPCTQRSTTCDERLRAVLASIEAQTLAMQNPPTPLEVQSLRLSILQLTPLLTPYPDMMSERDELGKIVEELPTTPASKQAPLRNRLTQLTDLLRVQLAAAQ